MGRKIKPKYRTDGISKNKKIAEQRMKPIPLMINEYKRNTNRPPKPATNSQNI